MLNFLRLGFDKATVVKQVPKTGSVVKMMPNLVAMKFGTKLRYLRQAVGLTQADLTQKLDFTAHTYISNLETGRKSPSLETTAKISKLFQVPIDYLLRDTIPIFAITPKELSNSQPNAYLRWCGGKLRTLRTMRGWSQDELSRRLSLAVSGYLSNLELGRQEPSLATLLRLADVFAVDIEEFLQEENEERVGKPK